jgi:hypothetical protein
LLSKQAFFVIPEAWGLVLSLYKYVRYIHALVNRPHKWCVEDPSLAISLAAALDLMILQVLMGLRAALLNQQASLKRQAVQGTDDLSAQVKLAQRCPTRLKRGSSYTDKV